MRFWLPTLLLAGLVALIVWRMLRRVRRDMHAGQAETHRAEAARVGTAGVGVGEDGSGEALTGALPVTYLSTTEAADWLRRAPGDLGHRARGTVQVTDRGLLLVRKGASPVYIDGENLRGARLERGAAGKVMGRRDVVVVAWQDWETGLHLDHRADVEPLLAAVAEVARG